MGTKSKRKKAKNRSAQTEAAAEKRLSVEPTPKKASLSPEPVPATADPQPENALTLEATHFSSFEASGPAPDDAASHKVKTSNLTPDEIARQLKALTEYINTYNKLIIERAKEYISIIEAISGSLAPAQASRLHALTLPYRMISKMQPLPAIPEMLEQNPTEEDLSVFCRTILSTEANQLSANIYWFSCVASNKRPLDEMILDLTKTSDPDLLDSLETKILSLRVDQTDGNTSLDRVLPIYTMAPIKYSPLLKSCIGEYLKPLKKNDENREIIRDLNQKAHPTDKINDPTVSEDLISAAEITENTAILASIRSIAENMDAKSDNINKFISDIARIAPGNPAFKENVRMAADAHLAGKENENEKYLLYYAKGALIYNNSRPIGDVKIKIVGILETLRAKLDATREKPESSLTENKPSNILDAYKKMLVTINDTISSVQRAYHVDELLKITDQIIAINDKNLFKPEKQALANLKAAAKEAKKSLKPMDEQDVKIQKAKSSPSLDALSKVQAEPSNESALKGSMNAVLDFFRSSNAKEAPEPETQLTAHQSSLVEQISGENYNIEVSELQKILTILNEDAKGELYKDCDDAPKTSAREAFAKYLFTHTLNDSDSDFNNQPSTNPADDAIKLEKLLGKKGVDLYNAALQEESKSKAYRDSVFFHSLKRQEGHLWSEQLVLHVGGPSGSGKSHSSKEILKKIDGIYSSQPKGTNLYVMVDGGIEREVSQMRQLVNQTALQKGYPGIKDLDAYDNTNIKSKIKAAAFADDKLSVVIPETNVDVGLADKFTGKVSKGLIPEMLAQSNLGKSQRKLDISSGRPRRIIMGQIVAPPGTNDEFQHLVQSQSNLRAYDHSYGEDFRKAIAVEGSNEKALELNPATRAPGEKLPIPESKAPGKSFKTGVRGSDATKNSYLGMSKSDLGGTPLYLEVVNDRIFLNYDKYTGLSNVKKAITPFPSTKRAAPLIYKLLDSLDPEERPKSDQAFQAFISPLNTAFSGLVINITTAGSATPHHSNLETSVAKLINDLCDNVKKIQRSGNHNSRQKIQALMRENQDLMQYLPESYKKWLANTMIPAAMSVATSAQAPSAATSARPEQSIAKATTNESSEANSLEAIQDSDDEFVAMPTKEALLKSSGARTQETNPMESTVYSGAPVLSEQAMPTNKRIPKGDNPHNVVVDGASGRSYQLISKPSSEERKAIEAQTGLVLASNPSIVLGKGGAGHVRIARVINDDNSLGEFLAVKKIKDQDDRTAKVETSKEEAKFLARCLEKGIEGLLIPKDTIHTTDKSGRNSLYQLMPIMTTDAEKLFGKDGKLTPDERKLRFEQLAQFMLPLITKMNQNELFHGDIKPSNILFDEKNNKFYLGDFGSSAASPESEEALYISSHGTESYYPLNRPKDDTLWFQARDQFALGLSLAECASVEASKIVTQIKDILYRRYNPGRRDTTDDEYIMIAENDIKTLIKNLKATLEASGLDPAYTNCIYELLSLDSKTPANISDINERFQAELKKLSPLEDTHFSNSFDASEPDLLTSQQVFGDDNAIEPDITTPPINPESMLDQAAKQPEPESTGDSSLKKSVNLDELMKETGPEEDYLEESFNPEDTIADPGVGSAAVRGSELKHATMQANTDLSTPNDPTSYHIADKNPSVYVPNRNGETLNLTRIENPRNRVEYYELTPEEITRANDALNGNDNQDAKELLFKGENPEMLRTDTHLMFANYHARNKFKEALERHLVDTGSDCKNESGDVTNLKGFLNTGSTKSPPSLFELYKNALKEEYNDPNFRHAVFAKSLTVVHGKPWPKRVVITLDGPSGSGKTTATNAVIEGPIREFFNQNSSSEDEQDNIIARIDGGIEREISKVKKLVLNAAIQKGYLGIEDLHSKDPERLIESVQSAALTCDNVHLAKPVTSPVIGMVAKGDKRKKVAAKGKAGLANVRSSVTHKFSSTSETPHEIFCQVVGDPNHPESFISTVEIQGELRAYLRKPQKRSQTQRSIQWSNEPNVCESKKPSAHVEKGNHGADSNKLAYFNKSEAAIGGKHFCVQVVNDSVYVSYDQTTNSWKPVLESEDLPGDMRRTTYRALEGINALQEALNDPLEAQDFQKINMCFGVLVNTQTMNDEERILDSEQESSFEMSVIRQLKLIAANIKLLKDSKQLDITEYASLVKLKASIENLLASELFDGEPVIPNHMDNEKVATALHNGDKLPTFRSLFSENTISKIDALLSEVDNTSQLAVNPTSESGSPEIRPGNTQKLGNETAPIVKPEKEIKPSNVESIQIHPTAPLVKKADQDKAAQREEETESWPRKVDEFLTAVNTGDPKKVKPLLEKNRDLLNAALNENGDTALIIAARNGYPDLVKELLAQEANLAVFTKKGKSVVDVVLAGNYTHFRCRDMILEEEHILARDLKSLILLKLRQSTQGMSKRDLTKINELIKMISNIDESAIDRNTRAKQLLDQTVSGRKISTALKQKLNDLNKLIKDKKLFKEPPEVKGSEHGERLLNTAIEFYSLVNDTLLKITSDNPSSETEKEKIQSLGNDFYVLFRESAFKDGASAYVSKIQHPIMRYFLLQFRLDAENREFSGNPQPSPPRSSATNARFYLDAVKNFDILRLIDSHGKNRKSTLNSSTTKPFSDQREQKNGETERTIVESESGARYQLIGTPNEEEAAAFKQSTGFDIASGKFTLGTGGQGKVRLARKINEDGSPGEFVAVKKINVDPENYLGEEAFQAKCRELALPGLSLSTDFIYTQNKNGNNTIYQFAPIAITNGDELEAILNDKDSDYDTRVSLFKDVATTLTTTLSALHANHLYHCDVKPENILLTKEGEILLTDFSSGQAYDDRGEPISSLPNSASSDYLPPRNNQETEFSLEKMAELRDSWALGLTLAELSCPEAKIICQEIKTLIANEREYGNTTESYNDLIRALEKWHADLKTALDNAKIDPDVSAIITNLLKPNESDRLTAQKAKMVLDTLSNDATRHDSQASANAALSSSVAETRPESNQNVTPAPTPTVSTPIAEMPNVNNPLLETFFEKSSSENAFEASIDPKLKLRVYCDFDGTLTGVAGETAFEDFSSYYAISSIDPFDEKYRKACYESFLNDPVNLNFQIQENAKSFLSKALSNPRIELVIVSKSHREFIEAALEQSGINPNQIIIIDRNQTVDSAGSVISATINHEQTYPSAGPVMFIGNDVSDVEFMNSDFAKRGRKTAFAHDQPGQLNFELIDKLSDDLLAGAQQEYTNEMTNSIFNPVKKLIQEIELTKIDLKFEEGAQLSISEARRYKQHLNKAYAKLGEAETLLESMEKSAESNPVDEALQDQTIEAKKKLSTAKSDLENTISEFKHKVIEPLTYMPPLPKPSRRERVARVFKPQKPTTPPLVEAATKGDATAIHRLIASDIFSDTQTHRPHILAAIEAAVTSLQRDSLNALFESPWLPPVNTLEGLATSLNASPVNAAGVGILNRKIRQLKDSIESLKHRATQLIDTAIQGATPEQLKAITALLNNHSLDDNDISVITNNLKAIINLDDLCSFTAPDKAILEQIRDKATARISELVTKKKNRILADELFTAAQDKPIDFDGKINLSQKISELGSSEVASEEKPESKSSVDSEWEEVDRIVREVNPSSIPQDHTNNEFDGILKDMHENSVPPNNPTDASSSVTQPEPLEATSAPEPLRADRPEQRAPVIDTDPESELNKELQQHVVTGDLKQVREALNKGADPNTLYQTGNSVLMAAAIHGHFDVVKLLLGHKADPNQVIDQKEQTTALDEINNQIERLLTKDNFDDKDRELVERRMQCRNAIVAHISENNFDPLAKQPKSTTPIEDLVAAIEDKSVEVKKILEEDITLAFESFKGKPIVMIAYETNNPDIIKAVINENNGSAKDQQGRTPLIAAIVDGQVEIAKTLIEQRAGINIRDNEGNTPLHHAILSGHSELVEPLLKMSEATLNDKNSLGQTPLILAAQMNDETAFNALTADEGQKINPLIQDNNGNAALMHAVEHDNPAMVRKLLEIGALPEQRNHKHTTPLSVARKRAKSEPVLQPIFTMLDNKAKAQKDEQKQQRGPGLLSRAASKFKDKLKAVKDRVVKQSPSSITENSEESSYEDESPDSDDSSFTASSSDTSNDSLFGDEAGTSLKTFTGKNTTGSSGEDTQSSTSESETNPSSSETLSSSLYETSAEDTSPREKATKKVRFADSSSVSTQTRESTARRPSHHSSSRSSDSFEDLSDTKSTSSSVSDSDDISDLSGANPSPTPLKVHPTRVTPSGGSTESEELSSDDSSQNTSMSTDSADASDAPVFNAPSADEWKKVNKATNALKAPAATPLASPSNSPSSSTPPGSPAPSGAPTPPPPPPAAAPKVASKIPPIPVPGATPAPAGKVKLLSISDMENIINNLKIEDKRLTHMLAYAKHAAVSETDARDDADLNKIEKTLVILAERFIKLSESLTATMNDPKTRNVTRETAENLQKAIISRHARLTQIESEITRAKARAKTNRGDLSVGHHGMQTALFQGDKHYELAKAKMDDFFADAAHSITASISTKIAVTPATKDRTTTFEAHRKNTHDVISASLRTTTGGAEPSVLHEIHFRDGDATKMQGNRQRVGLHTIPSHFVMQWALARVLDYKNDAHLEGGDMLVNCGDLTPDAVEAMRIVSKLHGITCFTENSSLKMNDKEIEAKARLVEKKYGGQGFILTADDAISKPRGPK